MHEKIRCTLCGWEQVASEDDPDSTLSDAIDHAIDIHGHDIQIGLPRSLVMVDAREETNR